MCAMDGSAAWGDVSTPSLQASCGITAVDAHQNEAFPSFMRLPAEIQVRIWRFIAEAAVAYARVHRVRLIITDAKTGCERGYPRLDRRDDEEDLHLDDDLIELEPTQQLADSTRTQRALLQACHQSRYEILTFLRLLPDALPLRGGGGLLRCNLSKDIILLSGLSASLIERYEQLTRHPARPRARFGDLEYLLRAESGSKFAGLEEIQHLALEFIQGPAKADRAAGGAAAAAAAGPEGARDDEDMLRRQRMDRIANCNAVMARFATSFPLLRELYLTQPVAALGAEAERRIVEHHATDSFFLGDDRVAEWYSMYPLPGWWDGEHGYYSHLASLTTLLYAFRLVAQRSDSPLPFPTATSNSSGDNSISNEDALLMRTVKLRILRHYSVASASVRPDHQAAGSGGLEWERSERYLLHLRAMMTEGYERSIFHHPDQLGLEGGW